MQSLQQFIEGFDFLKMRPDRSFVASGMPAGVYYRGICERGEQYALYHHHSRLKDYVYQVVPGAYEEKLTLDLPAGAYQADWVDPASGTVLASESFAHPGAHRTVSTPRHAIDVALRIKRRHRSDPVAANIAPSHIRSSRPARPISSTGAPQ
jgi:hypothetical protein